MKAIMISIKPKWCAKIMNGNKTIEVRKNKAIASAIQKLIDEQGCAEIYVYCSKDIEKLLHKNCADIYWVEDKDFSNKNKKLGLQTQPILNGKVPFKFHCHKVEKIRSYLEPEQWYMTSDLGGSGLLRKSCLTFKELDDYLLSGEGYAFHISDLEIFDRPKELSEFEHETKTRDNVKGYVYDFKSLTKAPQNFCYVEVE